MNPLMSGSATPVSQQPASTRPNRHTKATWPGASARQVWRGQYADHGRARVRWHGGEMEWRRAARMESPGATSQQEPSLFQAPAAPPGTSS
jgi:hypothetical protein